MIRAQGAIVGWTATTDGKAERFVGHDPAVNADWGFLVRKRKLRPVVDQLAPGLAVYRAGTATGAVILREADGTRVGAFTVVADKKPWRVAAPQVTAVTSISAMRDHGRYQAMGTLATVAFAGAIPADAAAVIVYRVEGDKAPTATPITWARVNGATGPVTIYVTPGRCGSEPTGLMPPAPGQRVVLAWVDAFGRVSPRSAPIKVK